MFRRIVVTTVMSSLVLFSSTGAALAAAGENAGCIGIGASVTATTGGSVPSVLAIVRGILGTKGVGAWVSPAAQQHQGTIEACFPGFPAP
jgi:hypothetical protein